jgi:hypothetical protein
MEWHFNIRGTVPLIEIAADAPDMGKSPVSLSAPS